jgi:RNA 3'-terminal phosphate cyclase (ATP)
VPSQPGVYRWDIGTAGAVSLVFQAVLWPLAFAHESSKVVLTGGTHVDWSPPVDYLQQVYLPTLAAQIAHPKAGLIQGHPLTASFASIAIQDWGWYPRGGGLIRASIQGNLSLRGLTCLERGSLRSVSVTSAVSNLPEHIRRRQADRAVFLIRKRGMKPQVEMIDPPSPGQGTVVFVLVEYRHAWAGFSSCGRIRKPAERVAEEACKAFFRYHKRGQPIDVHLADQLLLPMAFAKGVTQYAVESVTRHLVTNAWVIQQFLENVHIEIDGQEKDPGVVTVHVS